MRWQPAHLALALALGQAVLGFSAAAARADGPSPAPIPLPSPPQDPAPNPAADARTLYCLDPGNAGAVADAAVALGLARRGKDTPGDRLTGANGRQITVGDWRRADPQGFVAACDALVAERKLPKIPAEKPGHWWNRLPQWASALLIGTVPVVLGGLLTLFAPVVTTGRADRRRAADDLHRAATGYAAACRRCLTAWSGGAGLREQAAMQAPLETLLTDLRRAARRHPAWHRPGALADAFEQLDRDIAGADWSDKAARGDLARDLRARLETLHDRALGVAAALERPVRDRRKMRAA